MNDFNGLREAVKYLEDCKNEENHCLDYMLTYNEVEERFVEELGAGLKDEIRSLYEEEDYSSILDVLEGYE